MQANTEATATPTDCTNRKLRSLTRQVTRLYDEHLGECGLKTTQYSLLAMIARYGEVQPADLARELSLDPSTLTRGLQPLANSGWIVVGQGHDARSHLLSLTVQGRAKYNEARAFWKRAQQSLNRTLGVERVAQLHELIDACQASLDRAPTGE